jgi:hypothetical protein
VANFDTRITQYVKIKSVPVQIIKASTVIASNHSANMDPPVMVLFGTIVDGSFVWNFEFGLLEICLKFGFWCLEFSRSQLADYFLKRNL